MLPIKVKAKVKRGKLKAKVKYPLVGKAELELGSTSKLKAKVKAPFLFSAKFFGFFKLKKKKKMKRIIVILLIVIIIWCCLKNRDTITTSTLIDENISINISESNQTKDFEKITALVGDSDEKEKR